MFGVPEVGLEEREVVQVHGQAQLLQQGGQARPVQGGEARQGLHHGGRVVGAGQGGGLVHRGLPALNGVDEVALDSRQLLPGQPALQHVHLGVADQGALHPGHELHALGAGVSALVKLARQGLHRQQAVTGPGLGETLVPHHVRLGLGEYDVLGPLIDGGLDPLHVVAVEDAHALQMLDAQKAPQVCQQVSRLRAEALPLFHKDTVYHMSILPP